MSTIPMYLIVQSGPTAGQILPLPPSPLLIGRENDCDLVIPDPEVSRRHARILPIADGYRLEDLGSTNGTYVNERRVTAPVRLSTGDSIRLGDAVQLRVQSQADPSSDTPRRADDAEDTPPGGFRAPPRGPAVAPGTVPFYGGPPATSMGSGQPTMVQGQPAVASRRRRLLACGCLLLLAAAVCGAAVFWLDANRPDLLYAPLRALLELLNLGG